MPDLRAAVQWWLRGKVLCAGGAEGVLRPKGPQTKAPGFTPELYPDLFSRVAFVLEGRPMFAMDFNRELYAPFLEGRVRKAVFAPEGLPILARDFSPWDAPFPPARVPSGCLNRYAGQRGDQSRGSARIGRPSGTMIPLENAGKAQPLSAGLKETNSSAGSDPLRDA
jgi:hypothetical protein